MISIRGVLARKIQFYLIIVHLFLACFFTCVYYYFATFNPIDFNFSFQSVFLFLLLFYAFLSLIFSLFVYKKFFVIPLERIIDQIRNLLTGRTYKQILTDRTDEIGVIAHFFNEVTSSFENVSKALSESKKVSGELMMAGQLQKELMPISSPVIKGFDIAVKNRSAEELGGDNLDFLKIKQFYYLYVGDVTGHGVSAAIVMTMVNTLLNAYAEIYDSAHDILVQTNRRLKTRIKSTMFMSMLMLKWDELKRKMSFVGCGHEYLLIYRAKEGMCEAIKSGGIALGMVPDISKIVKEVELNLNKDDVIVLYSDGITEAKNMSGEMFGLNRLQEAIELFGSEESAQVIVQNISKNFSNFVEDQVQEDDMTLVVIKVLDQNKEGKTSMEQNQEKLNE